MDRFFIHNTGVLLLEEVNVTGHISRLACEYPITGIKKPIAKMLLTNFKTITFYQEIVIIRLSL
ncbi:hypothetical protein HA45_21795 [Pantoea rodasii]|nr:hypothetical protein HA45_21795 [Pantoea rodasii]